MDFLPSIVFLMMVLCSGLFLWGRYEHAEKRVARLGHVGYVRTSKRWRRKANRCKARYGHRCALCNTPNNLEAHHRTYIRIFHERQEDLICLCRECHQLFSDNQRLFIFNAKKGFRPPDPPLPHLLLDSLSELALDVWDGVRGKA